MGKSAKRSLVIVFHHSLTSSAVLQGATSFLAQPWSIKQVLC